MLIYVSPQFLNDKADQGNYNWELHSEYDTWTQAESHRVGGYPFFTQDDVRGWEHSEPLSNYVLLFQLASEYGDEGVELMWGDCGVGNFFIHPDDLANLRFDKAFFYLWLLLSIAIQPKNLYNTCPTFRYLFFKINWQKGSSVGLPTFNKEATYESKTKNQTWCR